VTLLISVGVFTLSKLGVLNRSDLQPPAIDPLQKQKEMERRAMFDKSPASLQAYGFAQKARELIFPALDPVRQQTALDLFQRSIKLDPYYFGGYAGAAQILTFMAFIQPVSPENQNIVRARSMTSRAQELAPTRAWVQSSLAWLAFVEGNFERALKLSNRSVILEPFDTHVRDFHSMITLFSGDFEKAIQIVAPQMQKSKRRALGIQLNIHAVANFHLENFPETIKTVSNITDYGAADSPLTTAYLAASFQKNGDTKSAEELCVKIKKSWPRFNAKALFQRIYRFQKHSDEILVPLEAAGCLSSNE